MRELIEVFNGGDLHATVALLHEEAVAIVPDGLPNAGVYEGRDGVRTMLEHWGEAWEQFTIRPEGFIRAGDAILVRARQIGRGRGSGIELAVEFVWVVRVRDGRVAYWRLCETLEEARTHAAG